jgi:hypothetical protein
LCHFSNPAGYTAILHGSTNTNDERRNVATDVERQWLSYKETQAFTHARRVFAELHGADPMDSLAVALKKFLEGHGGRWEGTATELWDVLSTRQVQGLPRNPDNLAVKVLAIASRSKAAMRAERGWRGKNRVLRLQLPKNGVGSVGGVGNQDLATNTANADPEDSSERVATIMRDPDGTPSLSSEEWEKV